MANSVKIQDVAASAGVSTATVSYVMNGKAEGLGITPATRQRVLEAIQKTGYRPNRAAREMALGCLPPAGQAQLLSCQVAELLSNDPNGQPLTTEQPNNLTTLLAAAGYSLVPVTSVNDLPQLTGIGLVGVLYRQKETSPLEGHASSWPGAKAAAPGMKAEIPETFPSPSTLTPEPVTVDLVAVPLQAPVDAADTAATTEEVPVVAQSSVVTAVLGGTETRETNLVVPPVDADACGEPSRTVPAASVTKETLPDTDGAGLSAGLSAEVSEAEEPEAETSPSTLTAEPVTVDPPPEPIQAPVEDAAETAATTEEVPVEVEFPVESPVVTAVPGGTVTSENSQGTDGARRSPSTLAAEPDIPPPPTTQQPNNSTTVFSPGPVDIEVAAQLPETPHPDPLPQGARGAELAPEPVSVILPTTQQPSNPTTVLPPEPESAIVEPVIDTSPSQAPVVEMVPVVVEPLPTEMSVVEPSPVPEPIAVETSAAPSSTTQQLNNCSFARA